MRKFLATLLTIFILLGQLFLQNRVNAMGDTMANLDKDSGIIGEKKTLQGTKTHHDPKTDITYTSRSKGATFVTPVVDGEIAHFKLLTEYKFDFACNGWRYWINEDLNPQEITSVRIGVTAKLVSPSKNVEIETKTIDLPAEAELSTSPSEEQRNIVQLRAVNDPFIGEERTLAAQQVIKWVIKNDLDKYYIKSSYDSLKFDLVRIGNKEFVKANVEISDSNKTKMCSIWALNYWGYRDKSEERRMLVWVAKVITDSDNFTDTMSKSHMIFETLSFDRNQVTYPDLME